MTASFAPMPAGLEAVYQRHQELGYPSTLVVGEQVARILTGENSELLVPFTL